MESKLWRGMSDEIPEADSIMVLGPKHHARIYLERG
jgi:hypothetical protein